MTFSTDFQNLVDDHMKGGEYPSEEALLRDALAALDSVKQSYEALRQEVQARAQQAGKGLAKPLDIESFLAEMRNGQWTSPIDPDRLSHVAERE